MDAGVQEQKEPRIMNVIFTFLVVSLVVAGNWGDNETDDYGDTTKTTSTMNLDQLEDYDQYEINEYEDVTRKIYHCAAREMGKNDSKPDRRVIQILDDNGISSLRQKPSHYLVRNVRQKMCQAGFSPFNVDIGSGSIHKRFKNTLRLMIYNTPGMFPSIKVIRSDLDRKRKREPQIWFKYEGNGNPLSAEFDYDNYFVNVYGDFSRIQVISKLLVAFKMHKRINNFNSSISDKVNLDLGIMEVIFVNLMTILMKDKGSVNLLVKALNGIRTDINPEGDVQLGFEQTMKDAVDQIDPLLYSSIWLQSTAEKFEVIRPKERTKSASGEPRHRKKS
ncbi:uncharacterized protein LOC135163582 isoform X2 [Diachasmimorpha longicaudata]|uniref:uncharacterized protein LOC135163582 isoform X2 n=1 Tax=Diachasmimorpha longicaudata TaxID=58733 RepID=UPI0030B8E03C